MASLHFFNFDILFPAFFRNFLFKLFIGIFELYFENNRLIQIVLIFLHSLNVFVILFQGNLLDNIYRSRISFFLVVINLLIVQIIRVYIILQRLAFDILIEFANFDFIGLKSMIRFLCEARSLINFLLNDFIFL